MWILIVFVLLLIIGPTRKIITGNWRFCFPAFAGAIAGWYLGKFTFGAYPIFWWVPLSWAIIMGAMSGQAAKAWLDEIFGGKK